MSVITQRNKTSLQAPSSIKAQGFMDQYKNDSEDKASPWLWAPSHNTGITWMTQIKSYIMEMVATLVFTFLLVFSVVSATIASPDTAVRSILVGLVGFGSYYMVTGWLRKPDSELPRHAGWLVTVSQMAVFRFGILHGLFYLVAQFVGALVAAALLLGLGDGGNPERWVPQLADTVGRAWLAEIIGAFAIIFSLLYNHMAGVPTNEEDNHRRDGEVMASVMRGVATLVFFRLGNWTFEPVVYLAGLFASGYNGGFLSDSSANHLSAAFFILVPMIGMVIAVLLYLLLGAAMTGDQGKGRVAKGVRLMPSEKQIHTQYVKLAE